MEPKWQMTANDVYGLLTLRGNLQVWPSFCQVAAQSGKATENKREALIRCPTVHLDGAFIKARLSLQTILHYSIISYCPSSEATKFNWSLKKW